VKNDDARVQRLSALAEKLGRLSGEAHNLVDDITAKMVARRAAIRPIAAKASRLLRSRRSRKPPGRPDRG
jgi:hypothetical protein